MNKPRERLNGYEPAEFKKKFQLIFLFITMALFILGARMWYLQIIKGEEYRQRSENNSVRLRKIKPMRGLIMDRGRRIMVDNQPSFDLVFVPGQKRDLGPVIERLRQLYSQRSLTPPSFSSLSGKPTPLVPLTIERNIGMEKVAVVEINALDLPGVVTEVTPVRQYLNGPMTAQVIGFTGEVSREELERDKTSELSPGDIIGKFGIEKYLDSHLRGKSGAEQVEVNAAGKAVRSLGRIPSVPGDNVVLTIDLDLQEAAWKAMGDRSGAVVAMDPRSGEVLAMVSSPSFDPNLFNSGISAAEWEKLASDRRHPMENRAVSGQYPPGSTYKPVVAIAALEEGLITPETSFYCNGTFEMGNRTFRCWNSKGHGHVKLHRAIVESCDVYFYNLGRLLGPDKIAAYARAFGLGSTLGVDLGREKGGLVPTRQWKLSRTKEAWQMGETISISIGQGFNLVTPLQLASLYGTIGNGGLLYRPRLIKQLESSDRHVIKTYGPEVLTTLTVRSQTVQLIKKALWGVVNERGGTGQVLRRPEADVCGKTGTAQVVGLPQDPKARKAKRLTAELQDHALFACFAPCDSPEIAVAVIVEHGGHGGSAAAPVAKRIIDAYFAKKKTTVVAKEDADKRGVGRAED